MLQKGFLDFRYENIMHVFCYKAMIKKCLTHNKNTCSSIFSRLNDSIKRNRTTVNKTTNQRIKNQKTLKPIKVLSDLVLSLLAYLNFFEILQIQTFSPLQT